MQVQTSPRGSQVLRRGLEPEEFTDVLRASRSTAGEAAAAWRVADLTCSVLGEASTADADRVAWLVARAEQLRHHLTHGEGSSPDRVLASVNDLLVALKERLAHLDAIAAHNGAERSAATVKKRIFEAVVHHGRLRPGDGVAELDLSAPRCRGLSDTRRGLRSAPGGSA
jgi:hypothetical protein